MGHYTKLGRYLVRNKINQKYIVENTGFSAEKVSNYYIEDRTLVYADEFYKIIKCTSLDFDDSCAEIFKDIDITNYESKWQSELGIFLFGYFKPLSYLQEKTGIDGVRLNKLLTDKKKRPYAAELYLIAKALNLKPSQLFDYFYGDGERPVVGA
ncbi:helix-turn-helix transcriptional regulator [Sphingobacterium phlebotomi]|uniref:Helix-turn-helix transcriptional regulator n=1 Tax=Sphingobacterium phlebotomi TaxID=2605433 RepID=A0A5D4H9K0_9SPHI|nr:helix-turn-helix transcriptional regulator [Sphingobacterium phlebotomi]TYR36913.1 helix-turn-helix transcriptional regulator [Sphingobacterium phlebotomi]